MNWLVSIAGIAIAALVLVVLVFALAAKDRQLGKANATIRNLEEQIGTLRAALESRRAADPDLADLRMPEEPEPNSST